MKTLVIRKRLAHVASAVLGVACVSTWTQVWIVLSQERFPGHGNALDLVLRAERVALWSGVLGLVLFATGSPKRMPGIAFLIGAVIGGGVLCWTWRAGF
jgi:hypothetical protein